MTASIILSTILFSCTEDTAKTATPPSSMQTLEHDGITRRYGMYFPDSYDGTANYPLIFNFHGGCMDAFSQMEAMNMRSIAEANNVILLYPEGTGEEGAEYCLIWNSGPYVNAEHNKTTTDDLGFLQALVDEVSETYAVDENRIYATGFSNGGFMTHSVGCYLSDIFAAIAPVAGMMNSEASDSTSDYPCNSSHPMPAIHFHGTADGEVPVAAGEAAVEYWAGFNNTAEPQRYSVEDGNRTIERYSYIGSEADVEYYKIIGGYHETFSNMDYEGATSLDLIWAFFSEYDINGRR